MTLMFCFDLPPFDRLRNSERERLGAGADLGYYPKDTVILHRLAPVDGLYVIARGQVQERRGRDVIMAYGVGDVFAVAALVEADASSTFVAVDETFCHIIPKPLFADLLRANAGFADFYFDDICARLRAVATVHASREMASLMMTRIGQAYMHPPLYVNGVTSAREAVALMKARNVNALLVRDSADGRERVGVLTGTDLREAVILEGRPPSAPVGAMARYDLIVLNVNDLLINALVLMAKHSVRRVVVKDADTIAGVLEQVDLLAFLSNHSQIIAVQVDRATTPEELIKAGGDVIGLIRALHSTGVKVRFIAELVTELNRKVFRRLFELLAPPEVQENICLIVMGSEGRGEQLLKTDQDNGLIVRDGFLWPELEAFSHRFTETLIAMGYPPCEGRIMVSNPEWSKSVSDYCNSLHGWIHQPDEAAQLNLAIFYDAAAVAGDPALLAQVKGYLMERLADNKAFFAHFARPTLSFETPVGLMATLFADREARHHIDIKKAGIFPLVHGIRSLALENRLTLTNTEDRLWALEDKGILDRKTVTEILGALEFMQVVRLEAHIDAAGAGTQSDNIVHLDALTKIDRDTFKDCLHVVKTFKEFITYHFKLNLF